MTDNGLSLESNFYAWILRLHHDQDSDIAWKLEGAKARVVRAADKEVVLEYWIRFLLICLINMIILIVRLLQVLFCKRLNLGYIQNPPPPPIGSFGGSQRQMLRDASLSSKRRPNIGNQPPPNLNPPQLRPRRPAPDGSGNRGRNNNNHNSKAPKTQVVSKNRKQQKVVSKNRKLKVEIEAYQERINRKYSPPFTNKEFQSGNLITRFPCKIKIDHTRSMSLYQVLARDREVVILNAH